VLRVGLSHKAGHKETRSMMCQQRGKQKDICCGLRDSAGLLLPYLLLYTAGNSSYFTHTEMLRAK
jgi:hypothetical protein